MRRQFNDFSMKLSSYFCYNVALIFSVLFVSISKSRNQTISDVNLVSRRFLLMVNELSFKSE